MRTGYEYLIPYKTGEIYCKMAEEDGVVVSKSSDLLHVRYKSGREESYKIGNIYTSMEGAEYKNELVTELKEGSRFKANDNLYYHKDFFEKDWLDPSKIIFKTNKIATIMVTSTPETYEDSSAVSKKTMRSVTTKITKERSFILKFDTNINNLVKVGDIVEPNSTLFVDTGDGYEAGNLSENTLSLLETLSSMSPRAKYKGIIDRIEVKYNGEISDMTPSLAKLAQSINKETLSKTKGTPYEAKNNRVSGEYTTSGKKLDLDTIQIKIFIEIDLDMGIGDKLVIGNQAKTVVGEVFDYNIHGVESGDEVDMMTSYVGFVHRIIDSPFRIGVTNRLVRLYSKNIVDAYFNK